MKKDMNFKKWIDKQGEYVTINDMLKLIPNFDMPILMKATILDEVAKTWFANEDVLYYPADCMKFECYGYC